MIVDTPVEEGNGYLKSNSLIPAHKEAKLDMMSAIDIPMYEGNRLRP